MRRHNPLAWTLLNIAHWSVFLAWIPTTAAATAVMAQQGRLPLELDPVLVGISSALATLAGATSLLIRINSILAEFPGVPLIRPRIFCAAHMLGSWLAGTAAFLAGRSHGWDVWYSLLFVLLLAFLGAKGVEILAEKYLSVYRPPGSTQ